jgi:hypothetical protein
MVAVCDLCCISNGWVAKELMEFAANNTFNIIQGRHLRSFVPNTSPQNQNRITHIVRFITQVCLKCSGKKEHKHTHTHTQKYPFFDRVLLKTITTIKLHTYYITHVNKPLLNAC